MEKVTTDWNTKQEDNLKKAYKLLLLLITFCSAPLNCEFVVTAGDKVNSTKKVEFLMKF